MPQSLKHAWRWLIGASAAAMLIASIPVSANAQTDGTPPEITLCVAKNGKIVGVNLQCKPYQHQIQLTCGRARRSGRTGPAGSHRRSRSGWADGPGRTSRTSRSGWLKGSYWPHRPARSDWISRTDRKYRSAGSSGPDWRPGSPGPRRLGRRPDWYPVRRHAGRNGRRLCGNPVGSEYWLRRVSDLPALYGARQRSRSSLGIT